MTPMQGMMLYNEYLESFEKLPAADFKNLLINAMHYNLGQETGELTPLADMFWPMLAAKIDQTRAAYEKRCKINQEITDKRMRSRRKASEQTTEEAPHGDVLFSDRNNEQMNHSVPQKTETSASSCNETDTNGNESYTNRNETYTNRNQHNITETETETITETETETVTETVTETETETVTTTKPQTQTERKTETRTKTISEAQTEPEHPLHAQTANANGMDLISDSDGSARAAERNGFDFGSDGSARTAERNGFDFGSDGSVRAAERNGFGFDSDADKRTAAHSNPHGSASPTAGSKLTPSIPTIEELQAYCSEVAPNVDPHEFISYYEQRGWKIAGVPVVSWKGLVKNWQERVRGQAGAKPTEQSPAQPAPSYDLDAFLAANMRHSFEDFG